MNQICEAPPGHRPDGATESGFGGLLFSKSKHSDKPEKGQDSGGPITLIQALARNNRLRPLLRRALGADKFMEALID